jgi:hypothetical protein
LDSNEPPQSKLYGYHRLADPLVVGLENNEFTVKKYSEIKDQVEAQKTDLLPPEALRT